MFSRIVSARAAVASLLLSTAFLAACSGGSDDPPPPPPPPPTPVDVLWVVPDAAAAITPAQRTAFTDGNLYFNAHTAANASGEIRGQLDNAGAIIRLASLDGAQEGLTGITAFGGGIVQVDATPLPPPNDTRVRVSGFLVTSGLVSITNAHIHQEARGTPGDAILQLNPAGASKDVWVVPDQATISTAQRDALLAGNLYFNVHTTAHPGGEIRGQLDKSGTVRLASLNGAQEGNASTALGAGIMAVDEVTGASAGFAVTTPFATTVTNAHVHGASARGANSSPVVGMTFGPTLVVIPDQPTILPPTTPAELVAAFLAGNLYFNVHTAAFLGGEIRGQIDTAGVVRVATLDGAQETPAAITTSALGAGLVAVGPDSGQVSGFIVTRGLASPTVAHLHLAARGATGNPPFLDLAK